MKNLIMISLVVLLIGVAGCANVLVTRMTPDGTEYTYQYIRWGNQGVDGFSLTSPDGWTITFDKQLSEFEFAFKLGLLSAQLGGGN